MQTTLQPPYKSGYFQTSDDHQLYYELWGNPQGKPAIFLHGGPGAGCDDHDKRFFDPAVWNVLFFDQRGAGKSKPFASLKNNTTEKLVEDIQKLMAFVGFEKALIFGGSWGSTLGLTFAITYPQKVSEMILRGIYLSTKEEEDYYIRGGAALFYPDAWERLISIVPNQYKSDPLPYYYEQIKTGSDKIREQFSYEFAYYEVSLISMNEGKAAIEKIMQAETWKTLGPLEMHYIANRCFLSENYILQNIDKITSIPTSIIHGRFDMICPAKTAFTLHKALPKSKLFITTAGHFSSEKQNTRRLIAEVKRYAK